MMMIIIIIVNGNEEQSSPEEEKMRNLEQLAKIKRKCNEFMENGERIMSSVMVGQLMKGVRILCKLNFALG